MLKKIDLIINLQSLDVRIFKLEAEIMNIPVLLSNFKNEIVNLENNFNNLKNNLLEETNKKKEMELELSNIEKNIEKYNLELNSVKTNERYKAIIELIKNSRVQKDTIEEKIILLLDKIDEINKQIFDARDFLNKRKKDIEEEKLKIEDNKKDLDIKISNFIKDREKLIFEIDNKPFIDLYETVKKYDPKGIVMAKVDIDSGICPSCNIKLPIQKVNEILTSSEPICCDNCSKIFYIL